MGEDHRVGFIKPGMSSKECWMFVHRDQCLLGHDADIVVWDSHPLALGATPKQVYIDGIAQLNSPFTAEKPASHQSPPRTPDFDQEAADAVKYDGLPPLEPEETTSGTVVFTNVSDVYIRRGQSIEQVATTSLTGHIGTVVITAGSITCIGSEENCLVDDIRATAIVRDLEGGSIASVLANYSILTLF